ncbi:precorrin-3B synthase [Paraburkholderia sp. BL27I4N3]|uniref:precorrin-3B synthase n=1 Tax=Paraburkholderia sp. BL27I4N3 TaxID=1938805 RepID=UPI000E25BC8D|nr:precorrin-3B synthase [Paraburkholderia sp. BL27I4N3]REE21901.1 precorrin-3B synthase [Paraburkholderia sp. BL27I4N3]
MSVLNQATPSTVLSDAAATLRPSACPGLLRIVAARDGGICRIKPPGGELSAAQARAIAEASARHAGGVIELTNRANVQVRGVKRGEEAALIAALIDAGLGPMPANGVAGPGNTAAANAVNAVAASAVNADAKSATDAEAANAVNEWASKAPDAAAQRVGTAHALSAAAAADDVRNVMISPAAGRDPFALFDTRPLCAELLAMLQSEARFAALSPKFALLLDGGERLARVDHPHDVWLAASQEADGVRFVFGFAGCPPVSAYAGALMQRQSTALAKPGVNNTGALAAILPSQVPALVRALLLTFLDLAAADATRMRHLLTAPHSVDAVLHHAEQYLDFPLTRNANLANWHRATPADANLRLGAHAQREPGAWHVGGQPPLGRLDADTLTGLATLSQQHGSATLHLTPWQSVLLPDIATHAVPTLLSGLNALGLACDPAHAITHLIACAGSSGCVKGLADTKSDALRLAARLPAGVDVHLSGCSRSCAAAHCAPFTLLAAAPGLYDLYRRDGRPGFGQCVARQLTIGEAADLLERLARSDTDA